MFKSNEGPVDRVVRVVAGLGLLVVGFVWLGGVVQIVAYGIGAVLVLTGAMGFCGLYTLLGINTCPVKAKTPAQGRSADSVGEENTNA